MFMFDVQPNTNENLSIIFCYNQIEVSITNIVLKLFKISGIILDMNMGMGGTPSKAGGINGCFSVVGHGREVSRSITSVLHVKYISSGPQS